jgi:hypothetical protein
VETFSTLERIEYLNTDDFIFTERGTKEKVILNKETGRIETYKK